MVIDMLVHLDASPTGITRAAVRRRSISADAVRRIHVFTDANGEQSLVVRSTVFRFVNLTVEDLADPAVSSGVRSLISEVRDRARVDADVVPFLASVA